MSNWLTVTQRRRLVGIGAIGMGITLAVGIARADDLAEFQGTWKVQFAEVGGKEVSKAVLKQLQVIVQGDKFTLVEGSKKEMAHILLDAKAKPSAIEFFKTSAKADKVWHGIYAFENKTIKLCWGPASADRPQTFATQKTDKNRYYILSKK
jgi:uncharacterized protein (TIGR03067 family)